jgi:hypothetical protein
MMPGKAEALAGEPAIPNTTSLDLPSGLAKLLAMDTFNPASPMTAPAGLMTSVSPQAMAQTAREPMLPSYAQGGAIGPGGAPLPPMGDMPPGQPGQMPGQMPGMGPDPGAVVSELSQRPAVQQWQGSPMDPTEMHGAIDTQLSQNPDAANQIKAALMSALQSGELTAQELNMGVQLIEAAVNNPSLYPQLRQFAVQQGIAGDEDLPQQYDRGFIMLLLTVAKSAQQVMQGGANVQGGAAPPQSPDMGAPPMGQMQSMAGGGDVRGPRDGPVPIMAHEGEYVVPKHVVGMKGREFFDKLVEKYSGGKQ